MSDDPDEYDDDREDEPRVPLGPLDPREAALVRRDLDDLAAFRNAFESGGFKGVSLFCEDCAEDHFYGWDILENNLRSLLESGEAPVHELAYDPHPEEYIDWDYAQGYLDGLADAGAPVLPLPDTAITGCPFCGSELPEGGERSIYCLTCGTHLGPARIARALIDQGWDVGAVAELLRAARIPPLRGLPKTR
ncbi:MAG: DUF5319 family protein [Egibacteraceae bacterium]